MRKSFDKCICQHFFCSLGSPFFYKFCSFEMQRYEVHIQMFSQQENIISASVLYVNDFTTVA